MSLEDADLAALAGVDKIYDIHYIFEIPYRKSFWFCPVRR
jgi:hypothetical protein